jgi:hypothetical protein
MRDLLERVTLNHSSEILYLYYMLPMHLALLLRLMWPGHESNHPPSCQAEVKDGAAIPPRPHMSSWPDA